jgi:RNA polymerase sigma-54 factor
VDKETVDNVLSDNDLVEKLSEKNIDIARRTVAKYRKALKIPSSTQRRRKLKAENYMG